MPARIQETPTFTIYDCAHVISPPRLSPFSVCNIENVGVASYLVCVSTTTRFNEAVLSDGQQAVSGSDSDKEDVGDEESLSTIITSEKLWTAVMTC